MAYRTLQDVALLTVNKLDLANLGARLQQLQTKAGKAIVRKAAGKAMVPVRRDAKANAPYDPTGDGMHIRSDVAMRGRWRGDTLVLKVGVKGGAKKNEETPFYFRFQEFGTKTIPAQPFLVPALDTNQQQVYDTLIAELTKALFT